MTRRLGLLTSARSPALAAPQMGLIAISYLAGEILILDGTLNRT